MALAHPGVVRCFELGETALAENGQPVGNVYYLVLEYLPGGSLFDLIQTATIGVHLARHLFKEIVALVQEIFSRGYVHLDLKLENIMIAADGSIKLIDFGFTERISGPTHNGRLNSFVGTPVYKSPEILQARPFAGCSSDIFALGVILFALTAQAFPFQNARSNDNLYSSFAQANPALYWQQVPRTPAMNSFPPQLETLLSCLFEYVPECRITIPEILSHPWVAEQPQLDPALARAQIKALCHLP